MRGLPKARAFLNPTENDVLGMSNFGNVKPGNDSHYPFMDRKIIHVPFFSSGQLQPILAENVNTGNFGLFSSNVPAHFGYDV